MNKNLKKVISSVSAAALTMTSLSALAVDFPDVPSTATYYQAVNNLSVLGIVGGYDDGTFQPDNEVTRAEFARMLATALGDGEVGAAGANGSSTFTDVNGHWAAGYIAAAVGRGIIDGYGDGTFGPEDPVTYEQIMKMLVCAINYDSYADANGGYPTGYVTQANSLKITQGVSYTDQTAPAKRSDVAVMIDNMLDTPIVGIDGYYPGTTVPITDVKDELGGDYATTLTEQDIYWVTGRVTETSVSGNLNSGEVRFQIEQANLFDGYYYPRVSSSDEAYAPMIMLSGDSGAENYLDSLGDALVQVTDDGDYKILAFYPSGRNSEATFESVNFADNYRGYNNYQDNGATTGQSILDSGRIYVYRDGSSSSVDSYSLSQDANDNTNVKLYVNGVEWTEDLAQGLTDYVVNNTTGTVTLIDTPEVGSTSADGKYDIIRTTYVGVGKVSSATTRNESFTVSFDGQEGLVSRLTIDTNDDDIQYTVTMNGEAAELSDIQEGDVLSISYDVVEGAQYSNFYDIEITRGTVSGTLERYQPATTTREATYYFGGTAYTAISSVGINTSDFSTEYTLWVDPFGRIIYAEEGASADTYAILEAVYQTSGDTGWNVRIKAADGSNQTYALRNASSSVTKENDDDQEITKANYQWIYDLCYTDNGGEFATGGTYNNNGGSTKAPLSERVISYSVSSSSGEIRDIEQESVVAQYDEYNANTNRVGSIRLSDTTTVLNADDAANMDADGNVTNIAGYGTSDISASDMTAFTDGATYGVIAAGRRTSDSTYSFAIIVEGESAWNADTTIAVFDSYGMENYNDENCYAIYAYAPGSDETDAPITIYAENNSAVVNKITAMQRGEVFIYNENSDGIVEEGADLAVLTSGLNSFVSDGQTTTSEDMLEAIYSAAKLADDNSEYDELYLKTNTDWDATQSSGSQEKVRVAFAPLISRSGNTITVGKIDKIDNAYVSDELEGQAVLSVASDAQVYVYDFSNTAEYRLSLGTIADATATIPNTAKPNRDNAEVTYIHDGVEDTVTVNANDVVWNALDQVGATNYVFVKTVDDVVTEMVVYISNI